MTRVDGNGPARCLDSGSVRVTELAIPGSFEFLPRTFPDDRGRFAAPFQEPAFEAAVGHGLRVAQVNTSVSRAGVIRGVHFANVPPGQAKYVYCPRGALVDVIVDLRVGSPDFGRHVAVRLDEDTCRAVYLPEGLGHAFVALAEDTTMVYLCTEGYNPTAEHGVNPMDPDLALPWTDLLDGREPILSDKDTTAPSLAQALSTDLLPRYQPPGPRDTP